MWDIHQMKCCSTVRENEIKHAGKWMELKLLYRKKKANYKCSFYMILLIYHKETKSKRWRIK